MFTNGTYRVLKVVADSEEVTRRRIADIIGVKYQSGSVGNALNTLRNAGFVKKVGFGQNTLFTVTPAGIEALHLVKKLEAMEG